MSVVLWRNPDYAIFDYTWLFLLTFPHAVGEVPLVFGHLHILAGPQFFSCLAGIKLTPLVAVRVLVPFAGASQGALLVELHFDVAMSCAAIGTPQRLRSAPKVLQHMWSKCRVAPVTALLTAVRLYILGRESFPHT